MSNIQTGAERMPHDLSHLGFLAGQIGRLITISTRSEERFSRNAETDLVCRLLLEKKKQRRDPHGAGRDEAPALPGWTPRAMRRMRTPATVYPLRHRSR